MEVGQGPKWGCSAKEKKIDRLPSRLRIDAARKTFQMKFMMCIVGSSTKWKYRGKSTRLVENHPTGITNAFDQILPLLFAYVGNTISVYCGVASRGRSIERPLLINGYAYLAGFIANITVLMYKCDYKTNKQD
jgi:hypothetical protein